MYDIIQYLLTFFISIYICKERKRQKVIEKNENDILFSTKKECESLVNDTYVNVDNFVEIGDFLADLRWIR